VYRNYFQLNNIGVIKSVRMRPVWNVAWKCIQGFGGEQESKRPFVRHRGRWQYNIKRSVMRGQWTGLICLRVGAIGGLSLTR